MPSWTGDNAGIKCALTAPTLERDKGDSSICPVAKNSGMRVCMGNLNDIVFAITSSASRGYNARFYVYNAKRQLEFQRAAVRN